MAQRPIKTLYVGASFICAVTCTYLFLSVLQTIVECVITIHGDRLEVLLNTRTLFHYFFNPVVKPPVPAKSLFKVLIAQRFLRGGGGRN